MRALTVLYDESCPLCIRCRDWMSGQRSFVPLRFVPCGSEEARTRYRSIPWLGGELVVVSDEGDVWAGPAAFLVCLWALEDWREWSDTLSGSVFAPMAERFFKALSSRRRAVAALLFPDRCEGGTCRVPPSQHRGAAYAAYR
jgi:predicted DCC family thiol-disulfide oxidoreductase YuxK